MLSEADRSCCAPLVYLPQVPALWQSFWAPYLIHPNTSFIQHSEAPHFIHSALCAGLEPGAQPAATCYCRQASMVLPCEPEESSLSSGRQQVFTLLTEGPVDQGWSLTATTPAPPQAQHPCAGHVLHPCTPVGGGPGCQL